MKPDPENPAPRTDPSILALEAFSKALGGETIQATLAAMALVLADVWNQCHPMPGGPQLFQAALNLAHSRGAPPLKLPNNGTGRIEVPNDIIIP